MTRLAFLFDADYRTRDLVLSWDDGLRAALGRLAKHWEVACFAPGEEGKYKVGGLLMRQQQTREDALAVAKLWEPDIALCWGSLDRPLHGFIRSVAPKTALCFAGGSTQHAFLGNFDLIFAETAFHVDTFRAQGTNVRQAFGVNTDLFKPNDYQRPHYLALHPAAFADYKRYSLFAEAFGERGLAVGQVQIRPDGSVFEAATCHAVCLANGVAVIPRMVPYYLMPYFYGLAETCAITATTYGGGDRAVLEAMSCGKPPIVCSDNVKLRMLLPDSRFVAEPEPAAIRAKAEDLSGLDRAELRDYVLCHYSTDVYARQLREGLESLL